MKTTVKHRSNVVRYYVAAALGTAWVGPAMAQDQQTLEEIVVTAQKREQNVQDVPIAISAFSGDMLQSKSIGDIGALTRFAPNVNLDTGSPFSGDTSVLSASIRGIGQDDFAFNLDPGVGVYLDGVYLARTIGANQSLLDIDRIEILKGPQGTLFGRNTIGGAISIVTHTPGDKPMLTASVTGGSYNRQDIALSADFPISDNFLTTLSFSSSAARWLSGRDSVPRELRTRPGAVGGGSADRLSQGGYCNFRHQGRAEPAGGTRQGAVESLRQFQSDHWRRLHLPEPAVVPDDGPRRDHAGGRRPAVGVRRVAAGPVRLHGRAVQLLHQPAGGVAQ